MIRVHDLSLRLGTHDALRGASFTLERGKVCVILGGNGAGKSSLLRALAGLLPPASGDVQLDGRPLHSLPATERAKRIGYLPQNGTPAWAVTVRELVGLGRLPYRTGLAAPSDDDEAAITQALRNADLPHLADRRVDSLSGGELARAKFARVLAGESDWILADEPLANLDPPHQRDVLALLRAAADAGKGVVVVLHQLTEAARIADDIVLLKKGACLAAGPKADALTSATLSATFDMEIDIFEVDGRIAVLPL